MSYPASKHSHFDLVPGHQNTTTKEPLLRPPDMRLVTALASKGPTLTSTLREMNLGPSGRETALQQLTTRDVVMIPDLFEPHSGFVMPKDPWENGSKKTIYQRLVEEIHHAGSLEATQGGGRLPHLRLARPLALALALALAPTPTLSRQCAPRQGLLDRQGRPLQGRRRWPLQGMAQDDAACCGRWAR